MTTPIIKDVEVADPPSDSVSALEFSPQADLLAVASWDGQVCAHSCVGEMYE